MFCAVVGSGERRYDRPPLRPPRRMSDSGSEKLVLGSIEDPFRRVVEGTRDYAIFLLDETGHVLSWNAGAQAIKGYSASEIVGKHISTFYTAEANARGWPQHELEQAAKVGRFEDEGWRGRK